MASRLEDGSQYGLLSSGFSGADKTVLQFKLTDSSLKSIEEYLRDKGHCRERPTIHFEGNYGVITIPTRSKSHEYTFTVQPIQAPEKSSLECIQQFRNRRGSEQLDSIGAIQTKISINATDEVYKTTQEKMKQADENMKKISTQEVSQVNLKPGRRVRINNPTSHAIKAMSGPTAPAVSSSAPSRTSSHLTSSQAPPKQPRAIPSKQSAKPSQPTPPPPSSNVPPKPSQPRPSSNSVVAHSGHRKSAVYNKPCRDRIIHLLALKPYKKPEIVVRLKSDGISEKEKSKISVALKEVGTMMKDNTYVLNKNLYSQIRDDWPLYSDEDRATVKRRIEQLRSKESPVRSQPSPSPVKAEINSDTVKRKRLILPEVVDYTAPKKARRIAHCNRSQPPSEGKISPSQSNSQPPTPQSGSYQSSVSSPSISTTKYSPDSSNSNDTAGKTIPKATEDDGYTAPSSREQHERGRETPSPAGQVSSCTPDYISEFPPITSRDQRARYKNQFYVEYPEYERISKDIMSATEVFTNLKNRLAGAKVDSHEYEQIREQILAENRKMETKREDFETMSTRYNYLHEKLSHVKQMIANYDKGICV